MIHKNKKERIQIEGAIRMLLEILKYFKQKESIAFNNLLNEEQKYYRKIDRNSPEAEQIYKEQLLEKFELRKQIFFEDDFYLKPSMLNEYVKIDIKSPAYYKNLDNGYKFIPNINYGDKIKAQNILDEARKIDRER